MAPQRVAGNLTRQGIGTQLEGPHSACFETLGDRETAPMVVVVVVVVIVVVLVLVVVVVVVVVLVLVLVLQESLQESLQSFMVDLD